MNHISPSFTLSNQQSDGFDALARDLRQWWHTLPHGLRSPVWSGLLATLIILGLLLAFHHVVHEAVQQSELRHQASARQAEASWRCNGLRGPAASSSCLAQLNLSALATPGK